MSEPAASRQDEPGPGSNPAAAPQAGPSAGAQLRAAREARGMGLEALAMSLKVPERKLEALEADRYDELPGLAFVRALAQTVCRQLNVDPAPVLARLPQAHETSARLEMVTRGLATRFREPATRSLAGGGLGSSEWPAWLQPSVLASVVLVLLALGFWFVPSGRALLGSVALPQAASDAGASADGIEKAASQAPNTVVETVHSVPQEAAPASGSLVPQAAAAGAAVLRATAESWVEVRDGNGGILMSRLMLPGEAVGVDGALPLRLKIGNADGTRLSFHNQAIDLAPYTRDNIARLELK
ncbi:MAG: helix-turn-helix domain-containing protein [Burkholderiales bacterium]